MSINKATYGKTSDHGVTEAALLPYDNDGYQAPTVEDVVALKAYSCLTGGEIAKLTGVAPRTVRKWLAPGDAKQHASLQTSA